MSKRLRISIVTPSYNQAPYLRETIESVLNQEGRGRDFDLEYIVVDGGSSDGSAEIIAEYDAELTWWCSESDRGQSHAINKGYAHCTGDVFNWLCSDDLFEEGALATVARTFSGPDPPDVLVGGCRMVFEDSRNIVRPAAGCQRHLPWENPLPQPSVFIRRALVPQSPLVREDLHYIMDLDLWRRIRDRGTQWKFSEDVLSVYRMTESNKTSVGGFDIVHEHDRYCRETMPQLLPLTGAYLRTRVALDLYRTRRRNPTLWRVTSPLWHSINAALKIAYGADRVDSLERFWGAFLWPVFAAEARCSVRQPTGIRDT